LYKVVSIFSVAYVMLKQGVAGRANGWLSSHCNYSRRTTVFRYI